MMFRGWTGAIVAVVLLASCRSDTSAHSTKTLTLATTTSTRDSGLLDLLVPLFEEKTGITVKVIAVGTGQALELGRRGDADVLLTHAKAAEEQFIAEGHGQRRIEVMFNDFVLLGAKSDPAEVKGITDIASAMQAIAQRKSTFVSRGDRSGTHMKERELWQAAGVEPDGDWYLETGSGMAATLRVAGEKGAYVLSDRSTFLAHRKQLDLEIVCEGDPRLRNIYAVMAVHPSRHPQVDIEAARQWIDFLLSDETQRRIARFGLKEYGQPLFFVESASADQSGT